VKRLIVAALLLIAPVRAFAGDGDDTVTHRVQAGDTLELLAAEYYGDRADSLFIMAANHMLHPRPLKKGEKIRVPVSREITTSVGDTFESLAQAYLGDKRRARLLAGFNGLTPDDSLAAGTVLSVPFTISYTAEFDIGLDKIAEAYFGDASKAPVLRDYNFLDKDVLAKGETIDVPIYHVKVREAMLPPVDAEAKARSEKRRVMQDQASTVLPNARAAWRAGDFAAVKRELAPISGDAAYLDVKLAVEIGVLLGGAYVATGDNDSAIAMFKGVLARRPNQELDAYHFSPKIRETWKRAVDSIK
jgi:hypothetical protein